MGVPRPPERYQDRYWLHLLLFFLTLLSTVYMGIGMASRILHYQQSPVWFTIGGLPVNSAALWDGLAFSLSLLGFLTVHEFGHYFAARRHGIAVSLPYYIPLPGIGVGTLGAVIRIREPIPSTRKLFDIGAAGPLAGFVVALGLLLYALVTLPPPSYLMAQEGHEAIKFYISQYGRFPEAMPDPGPNGLILVIGNTLLYGFLSQFFADAPPMYELYHYPMLFASWLGLFFTALNLLPVGQLDGGHILYALVGRRWHARLARAFFVLLLISGSVGFVDDMVPAIYEASRLAGDLSWFGLAALLYFFLSRIFEGDYRKTAPVLLGIIGIVVLGQYAGGVLRPIGYWFWLIWCLLIVTVIRIDHPPVLYTEPLTPARRALGILSLILFILCFSFRPLYVVM
jgi:membrane-associated protease RseP (regulator of RpoE activity)